jgi:hypothetical protein
VVCIYISLNELLAFHNNLNYGLNSKDQLTIIKLNFISLVQHEITHVILRGIANDVNASTPDLFNKTDKNVIKESGIMAEMIHYGGRIDRLSSSFRPDFNMKYCEDYLTKFETNQT